MSTQAAVTIRVLDREYKIGCPEDEKDGLLIAAEHLDGKMREVRDGGSIVGTEKVAVMAALNIAHEFIKNKNELDRHGLVLESRIQSILEKLEPVAS